MPDKAVGAEKLVWMDLEMTGLDPDTDTILEIATLVTDQDLNIIAEGPELVIKHSDADFSRMDDWNQTHHTQSGLWKRVLESSISIDQATEQTLNFLKDVVEERSAPLCGNSIWQDRRFIAKHMKPVDQYLHYRLLDVSSLKILSQIWYSSNAYFGAKKGRHRALEDIIESIEELKFYREKILK